MVCPVVFMCDKPQMTAIGVAMYVHTSTTVRSKLFLVFLLCQAAKLYHASGADNNARTAYREH